MAASLPKSGTRLFRTYAARGVRRAHCQPGALAVQWFQPPGPKRAFSSSGSDLSPPAASDSSDDGDDPADPDFPASPVGPRRRRPRGRVCRDQWTLAATQELRSLRPRHPQKCSTPRGRLRPPPFSSCHRGCPSVDLSVCRQSRDDTELGTSASLFSPPASSGAPASPDADSAVPSGFHFSAASPDEASLPCPQEAATDQGRSTTMAGRAEADFRLDPFSLVDSETTGDKEFVKESCRDRQQMSNRLKGPGLASEGKGRARGQQVVSQETDPVDYGEASGYKDLRVPEQISKSKRTGPLRKRKYQEAVGTSAPPYNQSKFIEKVSFLHP